ncbi:MAG: taurine dioxygenase [Deltaproteobacteria bacterium]|nr:taurine dioxygenase [Deltaproteobacteria bacterium]
MSNLTIQKLTPNTGAEIGGIDLREPTDPAVQDEILAALFEHHVLFFRNQDITPDQQIAFAKQFGPVSIGPFAPKYSSNPELAVLDQSSPKGDGADAWHHDNTFMAEPPMASILKAVKIPEVGGDTLWANMEAAYEALSPAIRHLVDGLSAVHDVTKPLMRGIASGHTDVKLEEVQAKWPPVTHPVVLAHPVTGRKSLYVSRNSTTHIVGLTERENEALLPMLTDHVRSPEFQCRFMWDTTSVAFWDNRSAQHFAVPDYSSRRIMNRVTIQGEKPL